MTSGSQPGTVPVSIRRLAPAQLSASQARDGHGGTPLHKAAGTANLVGVRELIYLGADVNAKNKRDQHPYDVAAVTNAQVRKAISDAGGVRSPTWDGESGRKTDPHTRRQGQGASSSRQQRAAEWRASGGASGSGSQPGKGASGSGSQPGKSASGSGSQPGKAGWKGKR